MKKYFDITVLVSPGPDDSFTVRVTSSESGQGQSTLRLPFHLQDLQGAVTGVAGAARDIGTVTPQVGAGAAQPRTAADFGAELFEALFQGECRDVFMATDSLAQMTADTGVRIRLSMNLQQPGMAEVASLPWELMCRKGHRPLVVSAASPLVRSLDAPRPIQPRPFVAPLRILTLMSNPKGSSPLDLAAERVRIEQNWARLPGVQVDFVRPVRAMVLSQLARFDYHVIHYMGHGDFDADEGGTLLLEHEDGSAEPVNGDEFAAWLADEPLRLVFLNACNTGATNARHGAHPFAGIATALIRERVPAVVAMQFPISDQAAIAFAQTFYERIAQGFPVDAAVAEGRKVLYSSKHSEWATPVLYMRSRDGLLFEPGADEAAPAKLVAPSVTLPAAVTLTAQPIAPDPAPPADSPWGAAVENGLRVFLATPDQDREKLHQQLSRALQALPDVQVIDKVPLDEDAHASAVDALVRSADLCVHLLGANAGRRLDVDDDQPLRTYPLVELDIAFQAARSQLVLITQQDLASVGNAAYAARLDELARLPRDQARFELVVADKNRIFDTVQVKLDAVRAAREAALAPDPATGPGMGGQTAFVDAHTGDEEPAIDLVSYLEAHDVNTELLTSSATDFAHLDDTVRKTALYIIVAGSVDKRWVTNRKLAILKSAMKARVPLLVARYSAQAPAEQGGQLSRASFDISALNDSDRSWVDALFPEADRP
ncbi:CHAT domain-containing protein [Variovorax sp. J22R133]|uniref:CHAT domain-containing protein n=1 Tax=Variovorax brevis TaxID=3053503 RepID=UPI0025786BD8|nr:CHAT domain-containing protein [Variovorax sp. J22R133]MDM0116135.1 CHAT domain-containing protein [Variovorax sp. J22R133]